MKWLNRERRNALKKMSGTSKTRKVDVIPPTCDSPQKLLIAIPCDAHMMDGRLVSMSFGTWYMEYGQEKLAAMKRL
jgi:hypothetical protein